MQKNEQDILQDKIKQFFLSYTELFATKNYQKIIALLKAQCQLKPLFTNHLLVVFCFLILCFEDVSQKLQNDLLKVLQKKELIYQNDILVKYAICCLYQKLNKSEQALMYYQELEGRMNNIIGLQLQDLIQKQFEFNCSDINQCELLLQKNPLNTQVLQKLILLKIQSNKKEECVQDMIKFANQIERNDLQELINLQAFEKVLQTNNQEVLKKQSFLKLINQSHIQQDKENILLFNKSIQLLQKNTIIKQQDGKEILTQLFEQSSNLQLSFLAFLNLVQLYKTMDKKQQLCQIYTQGLQKFENLVDMSNIERQLNSLQNELGSFENQLSKSSLNSMNFEENVIKQNERNQIQEQLKNLFKLLTTEEIKVRKTKAFMQRKTVLELKKIQSNRLLRRSQSINEYYESIKEQLIMEMCDGHFENNFKKEEEMLNKANEFLEKNNLAQFKYWLEKIYKKNPNFKPEIVLFSLGKINYMNNDYDWALFYFSECLTKFQIMQKECLSKIGKILEKKQELQQSLVTYKKIIKLYPEDNYGYYKIGKTYYKMNLLTQAENQFYDVIKSFPDDYKSKLYLALVKIQKQKKNYQQNKEIVELLSSAQQCLEDNDKFQFLIYYYFSVYYTKINKAESAIMYKQKAFALNPRRFDIIQDLVNLYLQQKKYNQALNMYKIGLQIEPNNKELTHKLGALYAYFQNYQKAIKYFQYIKSIEPSNFQANLTLSKIYREKMNQTQLAIQCLKDIYDFRNNEEVLYQLGLCYESLNDNRLSLHYFQRSVEVKENFEQGYLALSEHFFIRQQYDKAKEYFILLFKFNRACNEAIKGILNCNLKLQKYEENLDYYKNLELSFFQDPTIFICFAQSYFLFINSKYQSLNDEHRMELHQFLIKAIQYLDLSDFDSHSEVVQIYYKARMYNEGIKVLRMQLQNNNSPEFLFELAYGYFQINELQQSLNFLLSALKQDQVNPKYRFFLAKIYTNQKMYKKALGILRLLEQAFPKILKINYLKIEIFTRMGNSLLVEQQYQTLLKKGVNEDEIQATKDQINSKIQKQSFDCLDE